MGRLIDGLVGSIDGVVQIDVLRDEGHRIGPLRKRPLFIRLDVPHDSVPRRGRRGVVAVGRIGYKAQHKRMEVGLGGHTDTSITTGSYNRVTRRGDGAWPATD